jgi:peptide-methionine (S)-S-oxide reductase
VGYAGGTTTDPDYHMIYDHSETVQVDYDPSAVSYEELLYTFWNSHYPAYDEPIIQYKSIIFYHNEAQRRIAEQSRADFEAETGKKIYTEIRPYTAFYQAEDYHQKYYLRNFPEIEQELTAIYPDVQDFIDSTAVARVNGLAAGYGDKATILKEIGSYGLSEEAQQFLLERTNMPLVPGCPVPAPG